MLTSTSLSAFSIAPPAGADPVQRARVPGSGRDEPPPAAPVPPSNAGPPGGGAMPAEPGSRVLPRGSLVDLSV